MQRSWAHRWNQCGRSWPDPSQALTSGPSPRCTRETQLSPKESYKPAFRMADHEIAAKTAFRGYFRVPAALREDFINQGYENSQSRINEIAESSQIVPNRAKSCQIDAKNIVLQIRLKIERLASPAQAKPMSSQARVAATPCVQKMICARRPFLSMPQLGRAVIFRVCARRCECEHEKKRPLSSGIECDGGLWSIEL